MIICCYTEITHQWDEQELTDKLMRLPPQLQQAALRKRRWLDRQLFIAGKLLLVGVLKNMGQANLALSELKYNTHKRPYFEADIDFNISHSGDHVVCCGAEAGMIGVDIERISPINLDEYPDYFTRNEWDHINGHTDKYSGFFNIWTRKEAVLKAIGTGFHTPLDSVDVVKNEVEYDGIVYHIQSLKIADAHPCYIASTIKDNVKLVPVEL